MEGANVFAGVRRLAIVGGRYFADEESFKKEVRAVLAQNPGITTIVSGGADGAQAMAKWFAASAGLKYVEYGANWRRYGEAAGPMQDKFIVENSDGMLAFWDDETTGSRITTNIAAKRDNYPCKVIAYEEQPVRRSV